MLEIETHVAACVYLGQSVCGVGSVVFALGLALVRVLVVGDAPR